MKTTKHRKTTPWTNEDTEAFINYGSYFVPERELQFQIICDLIALPQGESRVLDLCCGEGVLAEQILSQYPRSLVYGYDGSEIMLKRAIQRNRENAARFKAEFINLAARNWRSKDVSFHAIVSALAIHHLKARQKQALFHDLFAMLQSGGSLVIADIVRPVSEAAWNLAAKMWDESVQKQATELDGHAGAFEFFCRNGWNYYRSPDPADRPSPLINQLKWMEAAGFRQVDVYWMKAGHAIFGGRKDSTSESSEVDETKGN